MRPYTRPIVSTDRIEAEATIAAVAVAWGTIGPIVRWIDLPAVVIASGRCLIGGAALWAWSSRRRGRGNSGRPEAPRIRMVISGLILALHWWALFAALERAPVGLVFLIVYLAPVLIALGSPMIGEQVTSRTWSAVVLGLAGTAIVIGPGADGASRAGIALALVAAVTYAVIALLDKTVSEIVGGLRLARVKLVVAGVVLLPVAIVTDVDPSQGSWGWLVVLGLFQTALGLTLVLDALAVTPASVAAVLLYLEPMSAVFFGWLLLGEQPTVAMLVGGAIIVAAGVVVSWRPSPRLV